MNKQLLYSLVALVLLVGVYFFYIEGSESGGERWKALDPGDIDTVKIHKYIYDDKAIRTTLIREKDDRWVLGPEEYLAGKFQMEKVLRIFTNERQFDLESTHQETYKKYGLHPEDRLEVEVWKGDKLVREMFFGKSTRHGNRNYVLLKPEGHVYTTEGAIVYDVDRTLPELRDHVILTFDPQDLVSFTVIDKNKQRLVVARQSVAGTEGENLVTPKLEPTWKDDQGNVLNETKVNEMVTSLKNFDCTEFLDRPKEDYEKRSPLRTLEVKTVKEDLIIKIYQDKLPPDAEEEDSPYRAVTPNRKSPYVISKEHWEKLSHSLAELKKAEE